MLVWACVGNSCVACESLSLHVGATEANFSCAPFHLSDCQAVASPPGALSPRRSGRHRPFLLGRLRDHQRSREMVPLQPPPLFLQTQRGRIDPSCDQQPDLSGLHQGRLHRRLRWTSESNQLSVSLPTPVSLAVPLVSSKPPVGRQCMVGSPWCTGSRLRIRVRQTLRKVSLCRPPPASPSSPQSDPGLC